MKSWNVILGVDVSKLTLDICCAERGLYLKTDNQAKGFAVFKKWCKTNQIDLKDTLVVMEHTGGYEYRFIQFCEALSIAYCRIPGLEIKQSMGVKKGNTAAANYLRAFIEELKASGFVADALKRSNQPDAAVAPKGDR